MSGGDPQAYTAVLRDGRTVGWYMDMLPPAGKEQDYMSVTIPTEDGASARELVRRGFSFADRSILLQVQLRHFRPAVPLGKKFTLSVTSDWDPEEIFSLAQDSFEMDDRFAVDIEKKDRPMKNELLHGFIVQFRQEGAQATCLYSAGGLEGFNLWRLHGDTGRIVLGCMAERYRGTGIALSMYSHTALAMREANVAVLRDIVATSNMASLDLHAMLIRCAGGGVRFGACRDSYKKERSVSA